MKKTDVALVGCSDYKRELVESSVERAVGLLGGPERIVGSGNSVFLKVNALLPAEPEKATTTHPEVVRAMVLQLKKVTDRITIGDSPGGLYNRAMLKRVYEKNGFAEVADETGAALNYDTSVTQVTLGDARTMKSITAAGAMLEADHLVSISKFKTHLFMNITGAIKNLFGLVPGMTKFTYHSKFNQEERFADLLVDILLVSKTCFHLVDAVQGMDENGPRKGRVKEMGIIAGGSDAFAVETLMMKLVGLEPAVNRPLKAAIDRGLCTGDFEELNVLGDDPGKLTVKDFHLPTKREASAFIPGFAMNRFGQLFSIRPRPDPSLCTGCGKCANICPENAISIVDGTAVIAYRRCIRCYCCHELCEHDALELEKPVMLRIALRLGA